MAQVTICDHCGKPVDEESAEFARVIFNVAQGGGGQLDYHNSEEAPCFDAVYECVKQESAFPDRYPDYAVKAPEAPA